MKKVGLISVRNHNYGSILQAYALQQFLFHEGVDNEIVYYQKQTGMKQIMRVFNRPLLRAKLKSIDLRMKALKDLQLKEILRRRESMFSEFCRNHFVFSSCIVGRAALEKAAHNYCGFLLGSDQVWNPMNLGSDFYTMSFVPENVYKATYASSFGVCEIPKYQINRTKEYLRRIDEISVREISGQKIIRSLIGDEVQVVADPTLLFSAEEWSKMIPFGQLINEPYIFAYFVGSNEEHRKVVKAIQKQTGHRVIQIPHVDEYVASDKSFYDGKFLDIGPAEFVNLIRNAEIVCTDSFHATVFSVQYHRKFVVFDRYKANDKASMNSRLFSILSKLGLVDRMVSMRNGTYDWFAEEIDYNATDAKLTEFREESITYLKHISRKLRKLQENSND